MRILVCGGRNYYDGHRVYEILNAIKRKHGIDVIIQGGATGADRFAGMWARANRVVNWEFKADWSKGKRAGPERNQQMLDDGKPDAVVAFPGGRGTADMIERARSAGLPVWRIKRCATN